MIEVIEYENKLTFILNYTELNFKYYNNEYFLNKGINAKVFILLDEPKFIPKNNSNNNLYKGGNNSLVQKNNLSLTIPYKYFFEYSDYINKYFYGKNGNNSGLKTNVFMDIMDRLTIIGRYIGNYTEKIFQKKKENKKEENKKEESKYLTIENIESNIQSFNPIELNEKIEEKEPEEKKQEMSVKKENDNKDEFILNTEEKDILSVNPNKKLKIEIHNILKYSKITEDEEATSYVKMYNIFKEKKGKIYIGDVYNYMVDGEVIVIGNIEKECEGLCNMEFDEEELKEIENTLFYKEIKYYLENI